MRRYLESGTKATRGEDGRTRLHRVIDNMVTIASDPNHPDSVAAARLLLERAYGKPEQFGPVHRNQRERQAKRVRASDEQAYTLGVFREP
jgi:hypothetical protein